MQADEIDYQALMKILSVPRPNGSPAERETARRLQSWLTERGIPYRSHGFLLYPYFFEAIGVWLILSRTLLAFSIWQHWGWLALPVALVGLAGGTLDTAMHIPLVSWPGARRGENLLIEFGPPGARREIILSAHYDSKTELLDHHRRAFFLRNLRFGIFLSLLLGLAGPLETILRAQGSPWVGFLAGFIATLALPLLLLAWGLGLNLSLGRRVRPSQGAVDNGAAVAILLGLAHRLHLQGAPSHTRVTIALFTGEEVNMQGSRAYVRSRDWPLPTAAVNLEIMAQDGEYVFWEHDGNAFGLVPTSGAVNEAVQAAVREATGKPPRPAGPVNSDGFSFLSAGIPTAVLGTYSARWGVAGFHRPSDNLERVVIERLPEGVEILTRLIQQYNH
jgi:acetylornithine deacetylase/succinyl-diaminopimelate desuccinylase-like protein